MSSPHLPQAYPLYAMVVGEDRYDIDPDLNRDPVEPIGPADVCMVIGWDHSQSDDVRDTVPILAQIDAHYGAGTDSSPIREVDNTVHYELRLALPTDGDRVYFAQRVAALVQAQLTRKRGTA